MDLSVCNAEDPLGYNSTRQKTSLLWTKKNGLECLQPLRPLIGLMMYDSTGEKEDKEVSDHQ